MKKRNILALLGTAAVLLPTAFSTAVSAQNSPADNDYLNNLYSFLQGQDEITYTMATSVLPAEYSVWAAQMFCQAFSTGAAPGELFEVYSDSALQQAEVQGTVLTDELAYSVGLYGGAVMNIGAAHYCPEYQPQVQQALQAL